MQQFIFPCSFDMRGLVPGPPPAGFSPGSTGGPAVRGPEFANVHQQRAYAARTGLESVGGNTDS